MEIEVGNLGQKANIILCHWIIYVCHLIAVEWKIKWTDNKRTSNGQHWKTTTIWLFLHYCCCPVLPPRRPIVPAPSPNFEHSCNVVSKNYTCSVLWLLLSLQKKMCRFTFCRVVKFWCTVLPMNSGELPGRRLLVESHHQSGAFSAKFKGSH